MAATRDGHYKWMALYANGGHDKSCPYDVLHIPADVHFRLYASA